MNCNGQRAVAAGRGRAGVDRAIMRVSAFGSARLAGELAPADALKKTTEITAGITPTWRRRETDVSVRVRAWGGRTADERR